MTSRIREHREAHVERLLLVLMGARLALALASLGIGVVLDAIGGEAPATEWPGFYITVALCFVATLVYRPFVGRIQRPRTFAAINVATDIALVSALVFFSGGNHSVFTFLYLAVGLYAGVMFPGWGALACSSAGSIAYAGVLGFGQAGWLGLAAISEPLGGLLTSWLVLSAALMATAGLAGFLARELVHAGRALDERTQDLEHLRTLHQRTVESLRSGLLTTDLAGRVTSFNREAQRITRLSRSQALGRHIKEVLPGLQALAHARANREQLARARMQYIGPAGRTLHLGFAAYVLRDAAGAAEGEVVIFQDVTEVVAMEQELRRSERLAAVGELSASIAHEIRNPLAAISGSIQMMHASRDASLGESKKLMEIVVREVDRLDRLIGDFLQFARPGAPRIAPVSVAEAIRGVLEMFEASRPETVEIERDLEPGLGVHADAEQLRQVLWNLLLNASQAMPDGGVVRIEARSSPAVAPQGDRSGGRREPEGEKPACAEIAVLDQGVGIPADVAEHMFDPFFTTKSEGTGLGLATVHRVIEEHRGVIRVERGTNGFATAIRISLPRAELGS